MVSSPAVSESSGIVPKNFLAFTPRGADELKWRSASSFYLNQPKNYIIGPSGLESFRWVNGRKRNNEARLTAEICEIIPTNLAMEKQV